MVLLWETETLEVGWVVLEQYLSLFNFSTVEKKNKQTLQGPEHYLTV